MTDISEQAVRQNLEDAGCDREMVEKFMELEKAGNIRGQMELHQSFDAERALYGSNGISVKNCSFDTKDAFWHAKNVVIRNSVVKGEYLAWYCENVTFENCRIIGTQPLCYCRNLKLINCEMIDCDLAFERSEVQATVATPVLSIKNPLSGRIVVPDVGEVIRDIPNAEGEVVISPLFGPGSRSEQTVGSPGRRAA